MKKLSLYLIYIIFILEILMLSSTIVMAIDSPNTCLKYYTCPDGTKIIECEISGTGCLCKQSPASLCLQEDKGDSCTKYYTCPDGTKVKECEIASNGMCGCKSNPASLCQQTKIPSTTYFKSCSYIWDSSSYIDQTIKITASIKDSADNTDSDSVEVKVVEENIGGGGSGYPIDGKTLDIQIIEPTSEKVKSGAVEIKISSKGPNELGEMSLGFFGEGYGIGFPISNKNCVAGVSGGGGPELVDKCEKYYICPDGLEIKYCDIIKQYDENSNVVGVGCACKQNPKELCKGSSGGGGSGEPIEIPLIGGGGSGPIICNGCILGDKCVPVGYRANNKYCDIGSEFLNQKEANSLCNNNFECSTNLCIDDKCISSGLWQRFLRLLRNLFG